MAKFKVGDTVRVSSMSSPYWPLLGSVVEIKTSVSDNTLVVVELDTKGSPIRHAFNTWQIELVGDKSSTKKDSDSSNPAQKYGIASSVSVLGAEYKIEFHKDSDDPRLPSCNGYIDWTSKLIVLADGRDGNLDDMAAHMKKVLRHEITHAFLTESGLAYCSSEEPWADNEEVVDWFAWQGPKIMKAWRDAGCL